MRNFCYTGKPYGMITDKRCPKCSHKLFVDTNGVAWCVKDWGGCGYCDDPVMQRYVAAVNVLAESGVSDAY